MKMFVAFFLLVLFKLTTYYFCIYQKKQHIPVPIHHQHAVPDSHIPPVCSPLSCFKMFCILHFSSIKSFASEATVLGIEKKGSGHCSEAFQ